VVTFTVRHDGGANETIIPLAWEDLDGDFTYESTGNVAPTEPYGIGGSTAFATGPASEAAAGTYTNFTVTKTTKTSDTFEASLAAVTCGNGVAVACTFFYDLNDIFSIEGDAANLDDFEAALSTGDVVTMTYDPDAPDQSNFAITTDASGTLTVTTPDAATTAATTTFSIVGASDPEALIRVKQDLNNDNDATDAGEGTVATATADLNGAWTAVVPLLTGTANNFVVTQDPAGSPVESGPVDVPTITQGASAGATISAQTTATNGGTAGVLAPGDVITITFSEPIAGLNDGDTITLVDVDGSTGTLIRGTNATMTLDGTGTIMTVTVTTVITTSGGTTGGIQVPATITAVGGFTDDDGEAINTTSNGVFRTFAGF
jgi:hypothetical protein